MTARTTEATLAVLVVLVLAPMAASGQQQGSPAPQEEPDTTELVFQREVFDYPSFERRNPFSPLVGAGEAGPRFEELRLLGILHSQESGLSVALLDAGGGGGQSDGALSQTYRVRQGQTLGNTRILDIQPTRVIVEVTEFGITEQRVLELQRPAEGGTS